MELNLTKFIKPKEFTFCSRCGNTCHLGGQAFTCYKCSSVFQTERILTMIDKRKIANERTESDLIKDFREKLALLRQKIESLI